MAPVDAPARAVKDLGIAIIGGSIAGCTAAIELARLGAQVSLFERSGEELKDRGAGLGVPASVFETFIARDLVDADLPYFPAPAFLRICRTANEARYGRLAWAQPATLAALNWGGLYRNLRKRVPAGVYRTHHQVIAIEQADEEHARLRFADGSQADFDLVVCADGYASLGRQTLFPAAALNYAGYVLWRGHMPEAALSEAPPLEVGIRCVGYDGGHGIFYFVPGANDSVAVGERLVNWGVYVAVPPSELTAFMTDKTGRVHQGSLPPGMMPLASERALKDRIERVMPAYYAEIIERSVDTFAYAIYDCQVPAYRRGRVCLAGDAGAFARPHSGAGALKGINDAIALGKALARGLPVDEALTAWDIERTAANNELVRFGNQLGRAFVTEIPDWSQMGVPAMEDWFNSVVTIKSDYIAARS
jgi:2-polyprenyl-6-methoxyphenol hydroxylase-like FAD-dependent oxidoreductase